MLAARRRRASANSTFQQIIGQIRQAPGALSRQEWRRFDLRSALVTTALGTGVLVGASLLSAGQALAGCVDVTGDPNVVSCDADRATTDDTLIVNNATNETDTDERHYLFSADGDIEVTTTVDGDITGFGLAVTTTQAGANIDMTHDGTINLDAGVPTQAPGGALVLETAGGDISYTGGGDILTDQNVNAFYLTTGGGTVTIDSTGAIRSDGGNGIVTENTGDVSIATGGPVEGETGISSTTAGGATVTVTIANDVTGTAGAGIVTSAENGDTEITATAGTVTGTTFGADATSTGTGTILVTGAGNYEGGAQAGISAVMTGIGPGAGTDGIVISGTGTTTSTAGTAIIGDIQNAANQSDILITRSGAINGATGGVDASRAGIGNIVISGIGPVTTTAGAGVSAVASGGNVDITPGGAVSGATGIAASTILNGTVTVTVADDVTGTAGAGIVTSAENGDSEITATAGTVTGSTFGADATSTGTGTILVTGAGNYEGGTQAGISAVMTGIGPGAGTDGIVISGTGTTTSTAGTAIIADIQNAANEFDILITRSGAINGATGGVDASTAGIGNIVVSGIGPVTTTAGAGVSAAASGGNVDITPGGAVSGATGIAASTILNGTVTVTVADDVTGTAGAGIVTSAENGDSEITATAGTVTGSTFGADATSTGTGTILVTGAGNYEGGTQAGISAVMTGIGPGAGTDGIVISGTGTTTSTAGTAIIAHIQNAANASDILITRSGAINGATGGVDASTAGIGNIVVSGIGPVTTTAGAGVSAVASGGNVDITPGGAVSGATGIFGSTIGSGTVTVTSAFDVTGTGGHGIETSAGNGDTTIAVNAGTVLSATADGINADSSGTGNIGVTVAEGATVTTGDAAGSGINVELTGTGEIDIENTGIVQGFFAAIRGTTDDAIQIVNDGLGLIRNLTADIGDLAISVTGTGDADIDNDGTILGRVSLDAGNDNFTNSGLWANTGGNDFGAGNDTITNSGVWATTGVSDFGDGDDSIINTGRIDVADIATMPEITHFDNLESFTNASTGVIDMVDDNAPNVGDELTIDGVYTGVQGSIIRMDLALVSGDPQLGSDLLTLDPANPAQGTSDLVFNIVSTGVTATTANTNRAVFAGGQLIAPVTVVENRGDLSTSSGDDDIPLARSGLISYDLVSAGADYQVVSQLDAGLAGGLLLPIPSTLAAVAFTTQRTPNPITATCIDPDNKPNAQGGWVRGMAGEFHTESAGSASTGGVSSDLSSENSTKFKTLQGGFDHVWCNLGSFASTFHLGVTVGHTWGDSIQDDPDQAAGVFGTDVAFETFFVGPYAAMTRGNFAAQASLRFDYHSLELSNPTVGVDADGLDVDAEGISAATSMSYDFELATLTLTPDVGVNVSNTDIDSFEIAGGSVALDDLWSVMGHVGVTARTQPLGVADNLFVVPFASATLYHEFIEHADGQIDIGGTVVEAESNRVGTFGQLGVGANAVRLGDVVAGRPTLFGGARFDLQVGERIEGATATVFGRVQF